MLKVLKRERILLLADVYQVALCSRSFVSILAYGHESSVMTEKVLFED